MEWLEALRGTTVAFDTAPFIYQIEENPRYLQVVAPLFEALDRGEFQAVTSTLTLLEVLIHPLRHGRPELAAKYREILLGANGLAIVAVSVAVAEAAAGLRATLNLRTPDAMQLATAIVGGATHFVTNDASLVAPSGLQFVVLDDILA